MPRVLRSGAVRWFSIPVLVVGGLLVGSTALRAADEEIVVEKDVTYGKGGEVDLKLDLARPATGDGPFPAIVFIHGGGWRGGSRQGYAGAIADAAKRGYVAVTVTYRLTDPDASGKARVPFPAQVHDVKCAVRWLRANAAKYKVDPQRIGATGGSAGGHLSLMVGLTDATHGLEGEGGHAGVSSRVQAVVNYYGPTDMPHLSATSPGAAPILAVFLGGKPEDAPAAYKASSPVTYASSDDPPVLSIHGAVDKLVPPDQAELIDAALRKAGGKHTTLILAGQSHGFQGEAAAKARQATIDFFDKHLKHGGK